MTVTIICHRYHYQVSSDLHYSFFYSVDSGDFRFIYRGGLSPQIKIKALSFQYKYTPQNWVRNSCRHTCIGANVIACDQQRSNNRVGPSPLRPPLKHATDHRDSVELTWEKDKSCRFSPCTVSSFIEHPIFCF